MPWVLPVDPVGSTRSGSGGQGNVLSLWRHRLMAETRGREIPIRGVMEDGSPEENATREVGEETERRPGSGFLRPRCSVGSHHLDPLIP